MILLEFLANLQFEEVYSNSLVVLIAFFLIFFAVIYSILFKTIFKEQKPTAVIVSLIVSFIAVYYLRNFIKELAIFNVLLIIASVVVLFLIAKPLFKFFRIETGF